MTSHFPRHALLALLALVPFMPHPAQAGPYLVKDFAIGDASSDPRVLGSSGGRVFFLTGSSSGYSRVLWSTDGSVAGTQQMAVVVPPFNDPGSVYFADVDGTAYFVNAASGGPEIWKSDGTMAGTSRVAASTASRMKDLTKVGGLLYFASSPDGSSFDLWKSDGTEAGTGMIADIDYGGPMDDVDGIAWFKGTDAAGWEAWRSDGTEAGTYRVADINPGSAPSHASGFFSIGGLVCFSASEPTAGHELWVSDGTEVGTHRVVDLNGTSSGSLPATTMKWGNKLYFSAYGPGGLYLYESDCTEAGTIALDPLADSVAPFDAGALLYYSAESPGTGRELWKTDGTPGGAIFVRDIHPGTVSSGLGGFVNFGGFTYFSANDGVLSNELWRTDGTSAGTTLVEDIVPGSIGSQIGPILVAGGVMVFAATSADTQRELWTSDGTAAGTSMLVDLSSGPSESSNPHDLIASGGNVFFENNTEAGILVSDGTYAGTSVIDSGETFEYADWNGRLVIAGDSFANPGIWIRDPDGTITSISSESGSGFTPIGDSLFYGRSGKALVTDGTPGGEVELASFPYTPCIGLICMPTGQSPFAFVDIGTTVLIPVRGLSASDDDELWKTDGTMAGTSKVTDITWKDGISSFDAAVLGGIVLFSASDAGSGLELWSSDGTASGTTLLADIEPGAAGSDPTTFVVAGGRVFFLATTTSGGRELWSTDGTTVGTVPAGEINPGPAHSSIQELEALGNIVVFAAQEPVAGRELWRSDGTVPGTARVADILPGAEGSNPVYIRSAGARAYFGADDGVAGTELWSTNGTEAGTHLVADINAGAAWSWPSEMTPSGAHLFFVATTFANGTELWAFTLPIHCGNGAVDSGETCDDGNQEVGDGCDDECILESCGDGVLDSGEQCDDGNRDDSDGCARSCTIDCPVAPEDDCSEPVETGASRLTMKANDNPAKAQLSWSWGDGDAVKDAFGDPTATTAFTVCVYDAVGLLFDANAGGGILCGERPCWSEQTFGFSFKRKTAVGSMQLKLRGSPDPGRGQIGLKLRGGEINLPHLPTVPPPLHVRLRNGLGCWGADFAYPFSKQTERVLKADSD